MVFSIIKFIDICRSITGIFEMKKSEKISKTTKKIFKVELFFFREKKQHRARGEPLLLIMYNNRKGILRRRQKI